MEIEEVKTREDLNTAFKQYKSSEHLLYKYMSLDRAKQVLEDSTLYYAPADSFNDPFELQADNIDFLVDEAYIKSVIEAKIPTAPREEKRRKFKEMLKSRHSFVDVMKKKYHEERSKHGITCFTSDPLIALMWAHYGDKHKGVCMGFRLDPLTDFPIMHVKYLKNRVPIKYSDKSGLIHLAFYYSKSDVWKYEKEVRALTYDYTGTVNFDKGCLEEIYFGLNSTDKDKEEITGILKDKAYPNLTKKQVKFVEMSYDLKADRI